MNRFLFLFAILLSAILSADASTPTMPYEVFAVCEPYLMPNTHPLKPILDRIFGHKRVTLTPRTFTKAGFTVLCKKKRSFIRVARHPLLPGHLVKVYLDSVLRIKRGKAGWRWLANRCLGAKQLREAIEQEKSKYFQVPRKWLYAIPEAHFPTNPHKRIKQPVLLVVEDMQLVSEKNNLAAWKKNVTKEHLDELYRIIRRAGGSSYRASNVWLSKNGKFSFIDTEYPEHQGYGAIRSYLSPEMRAYWDKLTS